MTKSIRKNFFYSAFLTTANYIFPFITFPYITRILGVSGIGICDFVDSIINYFILFSTMGIAVVGIREVASSQDDHEALSKSFSGLVSIIGIFTLIAIIILAITTYTVPKLYEYRKLMIFGGFKILFNFLLIEWFYRGLEEFRYITIRTLVIKTLYVISVFIFVRHSEDYTTYYLLTVLMIGGNALINSFHAHRSISFKFSFPQKTLISALVIYGVYSILTSFYTTFNVAYLGFATNTIQVGYYTTATRLFNIFIALFSAFTGVMLPRMSSLIKNKDLNEFKILYVKSIDLLCSLTIPIIFFAIALAPLIIRLIAGEGYEGAIRPMRIVMPLLFIIGYEQILVIQALMPLKKDRIVLRNSIFGAILGIIGNIILAPKLGAVGSAIVWICSEILILMLSQFAIKKIIGKGFPFRQLIINLTAYSPLILLYFIVDLPYSCYLSIVIAGSIAILYYLIITASIFPKNVVICQVKKIFRKSV